MGRTSMTFKLFKHQLDAIEKLHSGAVLVGGVGSGKTLTAAGYVFSKVRGGKSPAVGNAGYSTMKIDKQLYVITTARKRISLDWVKEASVFGIIPIVDSWNNVKKYTTIKDSFFIFDEQRLVGSGEWVKSFYKIVSNNQWLLLSATPGDTWLDYIPIMIGNGFYKNRTDFLRQHVVFNNYSRFPKVDHYVNVKRLISIRDSMLVNMHFVRNTTRHQRRILVEHNKEKTHKILVDRWNVFEEKPIKDISELCHLLRKVANTDVSRLISLKKIFNEHNKVIVFYNFVYELDLLRDFAEESMIPYSEWNGQKHEEILKNEPHWLYLCQYTAASEAWNAVETNTVVFYSQNYSYRIIEQASGRIDRINTPFTDLWYYHLVSNSPIDLAIRKRLLQKQNFNESRFQNY